MDSDCEMDPRAEPRGDKGKAPAVPAALPPSSSAPATSKSSPPFRKTVLKAPEREKASVQSPLKFLAIERKRQRESDAVAAATSTPINTAVTSTPSTAPPSSAAFTFAPNTAGPEFIPETQALRDENRDLKHQISVIAAQLASFQASMTAQISGLSS